MKKTRLFQTVTAAVLAALTAAATMLISIPIPGTKGYVNPGDMLVLLCGFFLGPVYGPLAAGLGSALADLALGFAYYAPATLLIKGLSALFAALLFRAVKKKPDLAALLGGLAAELWMVAGYYLYEYAVLGYGAAVALAGVPANLMQAAFGVLTAAALRRALWAVPAIRNFALKKETIKNGSANHQGTGE